MAEKLRINFGGILILNHEKFFFGGAHVRLRRRDFDLEKTFFDDTLYLFYIFVVEI
jgi:hypothetical protein